MMNTRLPTGSHFFIFGLSGVGKTTFMEVLAKNRLFYLPKYVVSRAPRADDRKEQYEYVSRLGAEQLKASSSLLIETDDGVQFYGYKKNVLKNSCFTLFNGFPSKIDVIRKMGGLCILIQGDATKGLKMRREPLEFRKKREAVNKYLQSEFYENPSVVKKMDLVLTNEFGKMKKIITIFKRFVCLKQHEKYALEGNPSSLVFVLMIHRYPIEGMHSEHSHQIFWIKQTFRDSSLTALFYLRVINDSRYFIEPKKN